MKISLRWEGNNCWLVMMMVDLGTHTFKQGGRFTDFMRLSHNVLKYDGVI